MRKLLLAGAALLALTGAANAAFVSDLGVDPNINVGRTPGLGAFDDQYSFFLAEAQVLTLTSITNGYPGGVLGGRFIANFTGSVVSNPDGIIGNGDDTTVIGPVAATQGCGFIVDCQSLAGSAVLAGGIYYLDISGNAQAFATYGGTLNTLALAVPGPKVGSFTLAGIIDLFK
jgi:hypothetical protein